MTVVKPNEEALRALTRVAIVFVAGDTVRTGFSFDLARMLGFMGANYRDIELRLFVEKGSVGPAARTALVQQALAKDCTHILFLDPSVRFPKDTIVRLLNRGEAVIGGSVVNAEEPIEPNALVSLDQVVYTEPSSSGLQSVSAIGMDVMLVNADIFRLLPKPWFGTGYDAELQIHFAEDVYFCALVAQSGHSVYVDHDLSKELVRLGEWALTHRHALAYREAVEAGADAVH